MEEAGQKLKRVRERLNLRYRDVEEASLIIADRHKNDEFTIALSRLADIENKGTVPSLYRMYSLCAIYRLDILDVLAWYGIDVSELPADAAQIVVEKSHLIGFKTEGHGDVRLPLKLDPGVDIRKTTYLSRMIQRWGRLPLMLLNSFDLDNHRYAYVGTEDWLMYPLLMPGALVLIDETKRKIVNGSWSNEYERPIYFLEHRNGFVCCWCNTTEKQVILQPHPASMCNLEIYLADEVDVIGQVVGMAMRLDLAKRRRTRS